MKRSVTPELLDSDSGSPREIAASLADLRFINRWFGGAATLASLLGRVAVEARISRMRVLDVGAATGDSAFRVRRQLQAQGVHLDITLLDRAPSHLLAARLKGDLSRIAADALALPFANSSFDVIACSTFAHHLDPEDLLRFVNEALRVGRIAVVVNDIRRHPLHLALVYAGFPLFRSRITRHDGPASVRRAYTPEELRAILQPSRASRVEISRHYLFRMGAIVWK